MNKMGGGTVGDNRSFAHDRGHVAGAGRLSDLGKDVHG